MQKRPSKRVRPVFDTNVKHKLEPGTFLHGIINSEDTIFKTFEKRPIYNESIYLKMLQKNNHELGIPYVDPKLPKFEPRVEPPKVQEPELDFPDRVYLKLKILKSGIVRVKLNTSIATLYERFYKKNKLPTMKNVIQAYKLHGFSDEFIERIKANYELKKQKQQKLEKFFEVFFNKETVKRPKKKEKEEKKEEHEDEVPEEDEIEEEDDDIPEDEGQMDVEPDEDEIVEELDEEYLSD